MHRFYHRTHGLGLGLGLGLGCRKPRPEPQPQPVSIHAVESRHAVLRITAPRSFGVRWLATALGWERRGSSGTGEV